MHACIKYPCNICSSGLNCCSVAGRKRKLSTKVMRNSLSHCMTSVSDASHYSNVIGKSMVQAHIRLSTFVELVSHRLSEILSRKESRVKLTSSSDGCNWLNPSRLWPFDLCHGYNHFMKSTAHSPSLFRRIHFRRGRPRDKRWWWSRCNPAWRYFCYAVYLLCRVWRNCHVAKATTY